MPPPQHTEELLGAPARMPSSAGEHGVYHLVVVAGGLFRGMISAADLLRVAAQDHKSRADLLEAFIVERPS